MFGRFRPPLLKRDSNQNLPLSPPSSTVANPGHAKRKYDVYKGAVDSNHNIERPSRQIKVTSGSGKSNVLKSQPDRIETGSAGQEFAVEGSLEICYDVLWRRITTKKHKTWDGDGILRVCGGSAHLLDVSGRNLGKTSCTLPLLTGSCLNIGVLQVEVVCVRSSGHTNGGIVASSLPEFDPGTSMKAFDFSNKILNRRRSRQTEHRENGRHNSDTRVDARGVQDKISQPQGLFKTPLKNNTVLPQDTSSKVTPRHDPQAPGALIMKRPQIVPIGKQLVDVVVDPIISSSLRPHQREGVQFLYECVMGLREAGTYGAIMADEMGLGKTFQTIALLWTLLKQNPIHKEPPIVRKALIVCPVTLIKNWRKEFRKWLGSDRIGVFVFDDSKRRLTDFTKGKSWSVMIIGYEKLRTVSEELRAAKCVDLVVADEGHRLKTAKNKTAQAISSLEVTRRVILTGTPLQNNLSEFFFMVDFVNPGILRRYKDFLKHFEAPIVQSHQAGARPEDIERGSARSEELASSTKKFILRRTAEVLSKLLPTKTEYILLCRPIKAQVLVYEHILSSSIFQSALGNTESALLLINILKKVCNSPSLLNIGSQGSGFGEGPSLSSSMLAELPTKLMRNNHASTKIRTLDRLLYGLRQMTEEKVVIVSNYTSTLSILENFLTSMGYSYLRLDGSTPTKRRQDIVDDFNRSDATSCFAFLLSAKAGGLGLNLVGASRLVLFDVDWNPATDLQAMARIHRDGQRRPCKIYRMFLAGGLEEKIWQRQITKLGLASNVLEQGTSVSSFTREELRDLFRLDQTSMCQTHDLLGCACEGMGMSKPAETFETSMDASNLPGVTAFVPSSLVDIKNQERCLAAGKGHAPGKKLEGLMLYKHLNTSKSSKLSDEELKALIDDDVLFEVLKDDENHVSFVFSKSSST